MTELTKTTLYVFMSSTACHDSLNELFRMTFKIDVLMCFKISVSRYLQGNSYQELCLNSL